MESEKMSSQTTHMAHGWWQDWATTMDKRIIAFIHEDRLIQGDPE
jgi:hypothetical protein